MKCIVRSVESRRLERQALRAALLPLLLVSALAWPVSLCRAQTASNPSSTPPNVQPQLVVQVGHSTVSGLDYLSVAFSPNGRVVLTGSNDGTAILWDASTGRSVRRFQGHAEPVNAVAFSADGRLVLTGSGDLETRQEQDKTMRLWDAATGIEVRRFEGFQYAVQSVAFSPDGKSVLGGSIGEARLFDTATGKELHRLDSGAPAIFSPDGHFIATGGYYAPQLWDASTGEKIRPLESHKDAITAIDFSPDGRFIATGSGRNINLLETATGKLARTIAGVQSKITALAFSPDGRLIAVATDGYNDRPLRVLDAATGKLNRAFEEQKSHVTGLAFSPDGARLISADADHSIRLWKVETGSEIQSFLGYSSGFTSARFTRDGRFIITAGFSDLSLWDTATGVKQKAILGQYGAVSDDGRNAWLKFLAQDSASLVNTETGEGVKNFEGTTGGKGAPLAFSPDGRYVITQTGKGGKDDDYAACLWETATERKVGCFKGHTFIVKSVDVSSDGRSVLTVGEDGTARLWDVSTGSEKMRLQTLSAALSADGRFVVSGSQEGAGNVMRYYDSLSGRVIRMDPSFKSLTDRERSASVWDTASGKPIARLTGHTDFVSAVAVSPDNRLALTGSWDGTARLWDIATGQETHRLTGHSGAINSVAFSADGRFIVTTSRDNTTRVWNAATGQELCRLVCFSEHKNTGTMGFISNEEERWVVVAPDGRFDTNNLDEIKGLHWIVPDDPFRPLPLEIFMRDYYEPRLLSRLLGGEKFKPIRALADLNRVQPNLQITKLEQQAGAPEMTTVTIEVAKASSEFLRDGQKITRRTGVYDLRLFRDGQLVAQSNAPVAQNLAATGASGDEELRAWQHASEIKLDPATGKAAIKFTNIRLPRSSEAKAVEFSAYAFNEDRVKSATETRTLQITKALAPVKGRAYIVSVGVNAYENPDWNLKFAANDARLADKVLSAGLAQTGEFAEVISVPLISDYDEAGKTVTDRSATKANFKAVLDLLSGKKTDAETLKAIPSAAKLRRATPEDLVLISFSSHGYADARGRFYFFPYDIGRGEGRKVTDDVLARAISSDELALWLKAVDAGDMVLIVDACQSAATVESEGFKPGPMGSRGLGQLAYDKGMRILAASQADDVALELNDLKHGLLTYALIRDGLETMKAANRRASMLVIGVDKVVLLKQWLEYAAARVPVLYEAARAGRIKELFEKEGSRGPVVSGQAGSLRNKSRFQQPALFDFARKSRNIILATASR